MVVVVCWVGPGGAGPGPPASPWENIAGQSKWIPDSGPRSSHPRPALLSAGLDLAQPLEKWPAWDLSPGFYPSLISLSFSYAALRKSLYFCMPPFPHLSNERKRMSGGGWSSVCSKGTSSGKPSFIAPGRLR